MLPTIEYHRSSVGFIAKYVEFPQQKTCQKNTEQPPCVGFRASHICHGVGHNTHEERAGQQDTAGRLAEAWRHGAWPGISIFNG